MHSISLVVASLALLAVCACAPSESEVIQHIAPKDEKTPSVIGSDALKSGAAVEDSGAAEVKDRHRRSAGLESDLLPSKGEEDASPFGETSQLEGGRGRIRVLPAFLG